MRRILLRCNLVAIATIREWHEASVATVPRDVGSWGMNGHGAEGRSGQLVTHRRHGSAELLKAYIPKVPLQRPYLVGRHNRPDIAVGTHEYPITGYQGVGVAQVAAVIEDIAARTECMDVQPRAWRNGIAFDLIAQ